MNCPVRARDANGAPVFASPGLGEHPQGEFSVRIAVSDPMELDFDAAKSSGGFPRRTLPRQWRFGGQ